MFYTESNDLVSHLFGAETSYPYMSAVTVADSEGGRAGSGPPFGRRSDARTLLGSLQRSQTSYSWFKGAYFWGGRGGSRERVRKGREGERRGGTDPRPLRKFLDLPLDSTFYSFLFLAPIGYLLYRGKIHVIVIRLLRQNAAQNVYTVSQTRANVGAF